MRGEGFVTSHTMLSGRGGIVVQGCLLILMGSFSLEPCLLTNPHFRTEHRVFGGMIYLRLLNYELEICKWSWGWRGCCDRRLTDPSGGTRKRF